MRGTFAPTIAPPLHAPARTRRAEAAIFQGTGAASLAALVARSHVPWLDTAWLYRQPITIDNGLNATSALSYYQVGVSLTGAAYTSFAAHAKADGSDLRVTDSDGTTLLSFALEGIDTANSAVYLLVKVPAVAAAAPRTIYVYYGNAAATSVSSYATTVRPATALVGPTDVLNQASQAGINGLAQMVLFNHQEQVNGGGAGLNGQLIIVCEAGGTAQEGDNSKLDVVRSTDGGATWGSPATILTPTSGKTAATRSITELADGTLLICYDYDLNATHVAGKAQHYIGMSVDGGTTWTNVSATPSNPVALPWTVGTDVGAAYGAMIEKTPGGDLYLPVYAKIVADTGFHSWLLKCPSGSDPTNGSNWVVQGIIAFDNANPYNETTVIQTTDSSHYLAIMRVSGVGGVGASGDLFLTTSADSGAKWATPTEMFMPGVTSSQWCAASPFLLKLASGNLALFWGIRYDGATTPLTIQIGAVVSSDGGTTWLDRSPASLYSMTNDSTNPGAIGYPFAVQRADGKIVVAFHHEVDGNSSSHYNVVSVLLDEDFIVNSPNIYESCESFTANFSSHGANATISTTHVHNGTNAVKIDNSLATGGTNDYVMLGFWPTNVALQSGRFAVSSWSYVTANDSQVAFSVKDGTAIFSSGPARVLVDIWGSNSNHVEWFNNSTWQDTGTAAAQNTWNKMTMSGNAQPTTVTGGNVRLNNATLTPSLGQDQTGAAPRFFQAQGASTGSTHNVIFWLDDVYTHQYTANPPLVTAGTEQTFSAPPTFTAPSSGAASLAALISAGVSQFTASASGAASLVALAAAGTGSFLAPGAGAAALVPLIAAGAGAFTARGTGAASLVSLVTAGAGSFMATGSGAASLVTLVAAGSGTAAGGAGSTLAVYPDPFGSTVVMTVDPFGSTAKLKGN